MTNEQIVKLYQQQQQIVDSALAGRIIPWQGHLASLLQMHGIVCFDHYSECELVRLNYLPRHFFAEVAIRNFMQVLSERPYDHLSGEILVANMLWSGIFNHRFIYDEFICLSYHCNTEREDKDAIPGHLLIPINGDLHQFKVRVTVVTTGLLHVYINAVHDLLCQPNLEEWDQRHALIVKLIS